MKKNNVYEAPEALVLKLNVADVITTSGGELFSDPDILQDGWIATGDLVGFIGE